MGLGMVLIRADASPEIGTGHAMRCLALAQEWQDQGGRAVFLMAQSTPAIRKRLLQENCEIVSCEEAPGSSSDASATVSAARCHRAEWIVLDGYRFASKYQSLISGNGLGVLYLDDLAACRGCSDDIILNPNLSASKSQYDRRAQSTNLLLGTRYCLLRREFVCWTTWRHSIPRLARRILVTLGGSTPENLALRIIETLARIKSEIESIVFVCGASSGESRSLSIAAESLGGKVTFHSAAMDMATLMSQADIAIAGAGATCWELCFMGLPSLLVDIADNQTSEARALDRLGCAKHVGSAGTLSSETLVGELSELLHSDERRRDMSTRCRKLVDGRGAERVVSAMRQHKSRTVHLPLDVAGARS